MHNAAVKIGWHASRWPIWAFVAALLLQAAMPFVADAAARVQGKPIGEICPVYGVALPQPHGTHDGHAAHHEGHGAHDGSPQHDHGGHRGHEHGDAHCALTGLSTMAASAPPVLPMASARPIEMPPRVAVPPPRGLDASALWTARRKHGPPHLT